MNPKDIKEALSKLNLDNRPRLGCPGRSMIHKTVLQDINFWGVISEKMRSLNTKVRNRCNSVKDLWGERVDPEEALNILKDMHSVVETECKIMLSNKSIYRYLWISRRYPWKLLEGQYATTKPYIKRLAHAAIYKYAQFESDLSKFGVTSDTSEVPILFNRSGVREFTAFLAHVCALDSIHTDIRWTGKDCPFKVRDTKKVVSPLKPLPNDDLRNAVDFFDRRVARPGGRTQDHLFDRTGTAIETGEILRAEVPEEIEEEGSLLWAFGGCNIDEYIPIPIFFGEEHTWLESNPSYFPLVISLSDFRIINSDSRIGESSLWENSLSSALLVSRLSLFCTYFFDIKVDTCFNFGYFLLGENRARHMYQNAKQEIIGDLPQIFPRLDFNLTFDDLIQQSTSRETEILPLINRSYLSRIEPVGNLCIDLNSLFAYIRKALEYPSTEGGQIAEVRADHFEVATQKRIDQSPWAPPERYKKIRGTQLEHCGQYITDIDAIGYKNGTLLLIDTKSRVFRSEYDAGDYDKVRNIKEDLINQAKTWKSKVSFIRENTVGTNYDFYNTEEIIGVICIPSPMYVPLGVATEEVKDNLLRVCSLSELCDWVDEERDRLLSPPERS